MNDLNEIFNQFQIFLNWNSSQGINLFFKKFHQFLLNFQHIFHQTNILKFYSFENVQPPEGISLIEFANKIRNGPFRFHSKISASISQIFSQWILDFVKKPINFANALISYFKIQKQYFQLFSQVTFPSIMFHFVSYEFCESTNIFLLEILKNGSNEMIISFYNSYLNNNFLFLNSLWSQFELKCLIKNPIYHDGDYFSIFLECLELSSRNLNEFHIKSLKSFHEFNSILFQDFIINHFLINQYKLYFSLKNKNYLNHPILKILKYCSNNLEIIFYKKILNYFLNPKYYSLLRNHLEIIDDLRTQIVFTCHEVFIIQDIVKNSPSTVSIPLLPNLQISNKYLNNFETLFLEMSLGNNFEKKLNKNISSIMLKNSNEIEIQKNSNFQRNYLQIFSLAHNLSIHPLELFNNESSIENLKLQKKINLLLNKDFYNYTLSKSINLLFDQSNLFSEFTQKLSNFKLN